MPKKITKKAREAYIKANGTHCPYCGSGAIEAGFFNGESCTSPAKCFDCGKRWLDIYKLVKVEDDNG